MAKKPKKEAVKPEEPTIAPMPIKMTGSKPVAKTVQKPPAVVPPPEPVPPPPPPVAPEPEKKVKRPRFVREKKEKRTQSQPVALPPRSTKATAKLMTKGLALPPKDEKGGQKPKV